MENLVEEDKANKRIAKLEELKSSMNRLIDELKLSGDQLAYKLDQEFENMKDNETNTKVNDLIRKSKEITAHLNEARGNIEKYDKEIKELKERKLDLSLNPQVELMKRNGGAVEEKVPQELPEPNNAERIEQLEAIIAAQKAEKVKLYVAKGEIMGDLEDGKVADDLVGPLIAQNDMLFKNIGDCDKRIEQCEKELQELGVSKKPDHKKLSINEFPIGFVPSLRRAAIVPQPERAQPANNESPDMVRLEEDIIRLRAEIADLQGALKLRVQEKGDVTSELDAQQLRIQGLQLDGEEKEQEIAILQRLVRMSPGEVAGEAEEADMSSGTASPMEEGDDNGEEPMQ